MKKPNIILILSDQHNASVMGCRDDEHVKTPNLDKLADNGVKFENCYCGAPLCVPSRSAFLTGQLPIKTQVLNNHQSLHPGRATLAHTMTNAGYETVLAGRMHFTGEDQCHGFEQRLVGDLTPFYQGYDFMTESFEDMYDAFLPGPAGFTKIGAGMTSIYEYDHDVVNAAVLHMSDKDDERPLFMTIGLSAPHPPYICDKERYDYYYECLSEVEQTEETAVNPALKDFVTLRKMDQLSKEDFRRIRAAYYGLIDYLDSNIGQLMDSIEATLGLENTVIIYASDHGDHMGRKNMIWKGSFLDDSARVPMIIQGPKDYLTGISVSEPVSLLDLTRTIIDMASAELLPAMDGDSLMDRLKNPDCIIDERAVISQIGTYPVTFTPSAMIRKGKYKLIDYYGYEQVSLYNMEEDPDETNDLGTDISYDTTIEELRSILHDKWDPEVAKEISSYTREHYQIINKWSHNTEYKKRENWKTKPGKNYLDKVVVS